MGSFGNVKKSSYYDVHLTLIEYGISIILQLKKIQYHLYDLANLFYIFKQDK